MAINTGMAGSSVTETDQSAQVASFPGAYGFIQIPAAKGPVNDPQLISGEEALLSIYTPNKTVEVGYDTSYFSALAFLSKSNKLWVNRVIGDGALFGGAVLVNASSTTTAHALLAGLEDPTTYSFNSTVVVGVAEVFTVTATAESSFNNKYFLFSTLTTDYYVWFNVNSAGTDPAVTDRTGIEVELATSANEETVATAIMAAINSVSGITATRVGALITATMSSTGVVTDAAAGTSGLSVAVTTQGVDAEDLRECLLIYQANQGDWGDDVYLKIKNYTTSPTVVKEPGAFIIYVYTASNLSTPVEQWLCSRTEGHKDGYGNNIFVEDVLLGSNYIRGYSNSAIDSSILPKEVTTALQFNGGDDGAAVTEGEMITGLSVAENTSSIAITILMDGGYTTVSYQQALNDIAVARKDCVAILSTKYSDESTSTYLNDIVEYRASELNLNSSYSALFTPHPYVYDKYNDRKLYVAPDGFAAGAISYSAANYEIWYAPAGYKRGTISVLDLRRRFSTTECGTLYDNQINPIRVIPGKGIVVWGQKTLQSRPSALDRLNVRLMLCVVEPAVLGYLDGYTFELNDIELRTSITSELSDYMDGIKSRKGVYDYYIVCDGTNNTASDIDNHRLNVWLYVKPTRTAEWLQCNVIITATGVSFEAVV